MEWRSKTVFTLGARARCLNTIIAFLSTHNRVLAHSRGTRSRPCTRTLDGTSVFGVPMSERKGILLGHQV